MFEAWDPVLRRRVAIKLLHGDDPDLVRRFVREAQAQARVDHPNICKVFEVGEVEGRPFIAMQLVAGMPLSRAWSGLAVEQKALLVKQVAEALHAAHKLGLVHRDLKPANIMVERDEAGALHPFVVDFGLVRELGAESLTVDGAAIGTPAFMAPEQAAGHSSQVDRRSDVYSLGATLYAALGGQPPFGGTTAVDVLRKVLDEEPAPLDQVAPGVPPDLVTIVSKCMEKDQARRYESARALAEDLGRFLEGEPIHARPASVIYRLRTRARKNRLAVGLGGAAVMATLVLGALWLVERRQANRRAELAQSFGRRVERAESTLWKALSLEPHDINRDRQALRETVAAIEAELRALGRIAQGPGHASIGRCYLALLDAGKAREHLERAWELGFRSPEVSRDLGSAFVALYEQGLRDLGTVPDLAQRQARKAELDRVLRDPARRLLIQTVPGELVEEPYSLAVMAFLDGQHAEALAYARQAARATPWRYEAWLLAANVLLVRAQAAEGAGQLDQALLWLAEAESAFRRAGRVAPSDPRVWQGICEVWREDLDTRVWSVGKADPEHHARVVEACNGALLVDPTGVWALLALAEAHTSWAELLQRRGEDARPILEAVLKAADSVLQRAPNHPEALSKRGMARWQIGKSEFGRGLDPLATFQTGLADLRVAREALPASFRLCIDHGLLALDIGVIQLQRSLDPRAVLSEAIEAFSRAAELDATRAGPLINLGLSLGVVLDWEVESGTGNPAETAERALQVLDRAEGLNPTLHWTPRSRAHVFLALGRLAGKQGRDPRTHLDRCVEEARTAAARDRGDPTSFNYLAMAYLARARYELDHGLSPEESLRHARRAIRDGLGINPTFIELRREEQQARELERLWRATRR